MVDITKSAPSDSTQFSTTNKPVITQMIAPESGAHGIPYQ
jgi:hypothetical protein